LALALSSLSRTDVQVNVSTDPERSVDITNGDKIIVDYTYSVNWREGPTPYERRMEKYSRYSFLPQHLEVGSFPGGVGLVKGGGGSQRGVNSITDAKGEVTGTHAFGHCLRSGHHRQQER